MMSIETMTLRERIEKERIVKSTAQPRTLKQLARNPKSINMSLAIQRNLRWTPEQKTALIESVLLGYPIPAVYTIKSDDNVTWILDGKQRLTTFITYLNNNWELQELPPVYGVDISGKKFSELPEEFREILEDYNIVFYQFERLTADQRDQLFKRLNSGTPLSSIELTRSILGTELLDWINEVTEKPFFQLVPFTEKQVDKYIHQEVVLQMMGIIKEQYDYLGGKKIQQLALDLRINGVPNELQQTIEEITEYLGQAFKEFEEKERKKILKKNDIVGLVGAATYAIKNGIEPEQFGERTGALIMKPSSAYKATKGAGTAGADKVRKRIEVLIECLKD